MKAMVWGECRGDYILKCVTAPLVLPTEIEGRGECPWDYIGIVPVRIRPPGKSGVSRFVVAYSLTGEYVRDYIFSIRKCLVHLCRPL